MPNEKTNPSGAYYFDDAFTHIKRLTKSLSAAIEHARATPTLRSDVDTLRECGDLITQLTAKLSDLM